MKGKAIALPFTPEGPGGSVCGATAYPAASTVHKLRFLELADSSAPRP